MAAVKKKNEVDKCHFHAWDTKSSFQVQQCAALKFIGISYFENFHGLLNIVSNVPCNLKKNLKEIYILSWGISKSKVENYDFFLNCVLDEATAQWK